MSDQVKTPETSTGRVTPQDGTKPSDAKRPENSQSELNERLDDALEETFPSSDPVSVKITK